MELVHPYSSNLYNSYGNFNHQNDKPAFHHSNNISNNRILKTNRNLDTNTFNFSNLIKNNFNKHDSTFSQYTDLDKNNDLIEFKSGMQDVPAWLKSLRLHKYKLIFSELTYEEMLALTEQQLEEKNVTKGARHKIIVNIDKLRARQSNVIGMEKCIEHEGISGMRQCLNELKNMLMTPIKAFEGDKVIRDTNSQEIAEGDLPSQIMKLLEKVYVCLQNDSMRDDEIISLYLMNCDKVLSHEAFTAFHKQRLLKIKSKLEPFRHPNHHTKNGLDGKLNNRMKWNGNNMHTSAPLANLQAFHQFKNNNPKFNHNHTNNNNTNTNTNSNINNTTNNCNSNQSNFNSMNNHSQQQNFISKVGHMNKQAGIQVPNYNNHFANARMNALNIHKLNEPHHKFNVNAECFDSSKTKTILHVKQNASKYQHLIRLVNENNARKLGENRSMLDGDHLNDKLCEAYDENEKEMNQKIDTNCSTKIITPLSSCSLFNACSQIGKFNKLTNQFNSYDKLNNLDSDCLKPNNQYILSNLFNDSNIMKCLENNSSLVNSNVFSHEKLESNYETDDFDDKLDENHQIYNHIELLSLRMTEQALGSSEFS